jgi:cellobiose-specific phosphotransferase system component IIC
MDWMGSAALVIVLASAFIACLWAGWRVHEALTRGRADERESTGAGYIVSASLALLGLLIGFTLAMSLDRYEFRRHLVVEEANALSTTWLRSQLLDAPHRERLDALLRDYAKERRGWAAAGTRRASLDGADQRAAALQTQIWRETVAALREPGAGPFATAVLQATSELFDLQTERRAALDAQVPAPVLWTLVLVALVVAAITGYALAAGQHRHRIASGALFFAVAAMIGLIFEFDQPRTGLIRVPQAPIERVADAILAPAP